MYQIKKTAEITEKIKASKFIARVYSVQSREAAQKIVNEVESEHPKANHVCWACRVAYNDESLGYSLDAGEPHGSAGPPILAAIEGRDLVNVLCVVIRYFGGTKLGIGGLIRAYGGIAAKVLDEAGIIEHSPKISIIIQGTPEGYSDIMRILRKYRLSVQPGFTENSVQVNCEVTPEEFDNLSREIQIIPLTSVEKT